MMNAPVGPAHAREEALDLVHRKCSLTLPLAIGGRKGPIVPMCNALPLCHRLLRLAVTCNRQTASRLSFG
jgi:hypothetical protein